LGWQHFLQFAVEVCAITPHERDQILRDVWAILSAAAATQNEEITDQAPEVRFFKLLNAVLTSGRAHVTGDDGLEPADPQLWGWRRTDSGNGEESGPCWKPQGKQIGWVEDRDLFLDPDATYAELQRLGDDQGERLALSRMQLGKHLKAA